MSSNSDSKGFCGCIVALWIFVAICSGIRSCIVGIFTGEVELPRFGSSRVSGGYGSHGTSNGYNVKYQQSTSPNYNSSSDDYSYTNDKATEHKKGSNSYSVPSKSSNHSSPSSGSYSNIKIESKYQNSSLKNVCPVCNGTGTVNRQYWNGKGYSITQSWCNYCCGQGTK